MRFLSEKAISLHKEYIEKEKIRLSFFEKIYPNVNIYDFGCLIRSRCKEKREIASSLMNIRCHEIFFSSYGGEYQQSAVIREGFGSESLFLHELYKYASEAKGKFVFISKTSKGIALGAGDEFYLAKLHFPVLVIDLCEHAYFLDYGFDREKYLKSLLPYLNISLFDKKICCKD